MPIFFHSELPGFNLRNKKGIKEWINKTLSDHGKKPGQINFIFCSDDYLHRINLQYLDHDTLTDIITFPLESDKPDQVSSDIFISVDRIRENAEKFHVDESEELSRVMIHGILHLCGYGDKSPGQKKKMRETEDFYLSRLK